MQARIRVTSVFFCGTEMHNNCSASISHFISKPGNPDLCHPPNERTNVYPDIFKIFTNIFNEIQFILLPLIILTSHHFLRFPIIFQGPLQDFPETFSFTSVLVTSYKLLGVNDRWQRGIRVRAENLFLHLGVDHFPRPQEAIHRSSSSKRFTTSHTYDECLKFISF